MRMSVCIVIAAVCMTGIAVSARANPADNMKVTAGAEKCIDAFSVKKKVKNNCGRDIFVPTGTAAEWSTFRGKAPACVVISECQTACEKAGGSLFNAGGKIICRFSSVPPGYWTLSGACNRYGMSPYQGWSATASSSCTAAIDPQICSPCSTGGHGWDNWAPERCTYYRRGCGSCPCVDDQTCAAQITQAGCSFD